MMVNLGYTFSLMMRFMVTSSLLFILVSCFLKRSNALEGRKDTAIDSHYHTVQMSSLLPASVCSPSTTKGSNKKSTLEVFHRHGPCSQQGKNKAATTPSLSEILSHDQSRVESIQARINPNSNTNKIKNINSNLNQLKGKKANLQLQSGLSLGSGDYIVAIGLGTPKRTLSLVFDTGSELTWTQCEPCPGCYQQQDPIFNPSASTTYSNVSCYSPECSELIAATFQSPGCDTDFGTCVYGILYGDQSYSMGFFSKDKLTITATDVFRDFLFGCGQINQMLSGDRTAGIIGFGRNNMSITSQTARKYGRYFSYCLSSTSSSTGHLTLGKKGVPRNVRFTPFDTSRNAPFYFIDIISISVGGRQLPIRQSVFRTAGSIIDSGTVITRLPPAAYRIMRAAFQKLMTKYPSAPPNSLLDTCYDLSGYTTVTIPTISFTLSGNVKLELDPSGILIVISGSRVCLAFAGNSDASDVGIFGNSQQKTFEVVYDVTGGNIGFAPGGCK